jgi:hypothetical protein
MYDKTAKTVITVTIVTSFITYTVAIAAATTTMSTTAPGFTEVTTPYVATAASSIKTPRVASLG